MFRRLSAGGRLSVFGRLSFGLVLQALALKLIVVHDPEQFARIKHRLTPRRDRRSAAAAPARPALDGPR
jgi:hypothetical protein